MPTRADSPARSRQRNLLRQVLEWSEAFEAGRLDDSAASDGILDPEERFALRTGPLKEVSFVRGATSVRESGRTGELLATDHRCLLLDGATVTAQWIWSVDVARLAPLADGRGVVWSAPTHGRGGAHHLRGLVVLPYASAREPIPMSEVRAGLLQFMKVQVAWRASRPGGVPAWRAEFLAKHASQLMAR